MKPSNKTTHARLITSNFDRPSVMVHHENLDTRVAMLAKEMATRWGMIAAKPDGEDSSGRAKLALLSVQEVVTRAIETAEQLDTALFERGHYVESPIKEIDAALTKFTKRLNKD